jgi:hypothetical protein
MTYTAECPSTGSAGRHSDNYYDGWPCSWCGEHMKGCLACLEECGFEGECKDCPDERHF